MTFSGINHFTEDEFKCKCCGAVDMDRHFIRCLDMARAHAGIPFVITSGYRCAHHNKEVGGAALSAHMDGFAADIAVSSASARFKILHTLLRFGFKRIGIYKTWIHADMHSHRPQEVAWYR